MFLGTYNYNIDLKGRTSIPAKMREELGARFVVSRSIANCLEIYPIKKWESLMERIGEKPYVEQQDLLRFFCSGSQEIELDKQGRFCLSSELRDFAALTDVAVIAGKQSTIEIWNKERFEIINSSITSQNIIDVMKNIEF